MISTTVEPDAERVLAAVTVALRIEAIAADIFAVHVDDMIRLTATDHIPPTSHGPNLKPERTSEPGGVDHRAVRSTARQSLRFPPFRPDGPPWGGPRRSASSNAAKAAAGTRHSLPLSR